MDVEVVVDSLRTHRIVEVSDKGEKSGVVMEAYLVAGFLHKAQDGVVAGLSSPLLVFDLLLHLSHQLLNQFQGVVLALLAKALLCFDHLVEVPYLVHCRFQCLVVCVLSLDAFSFDEFHERGQLRLQIVGYVLYHMLSLLALDLHVVLQLLNSLFKHCKNSIFSLFSLKNFVLELTIHLAVQSLELFYTGLRLVGVGPIILLNYLGELEYLAFEGGHFLIVVLCDMQEPVF